VLSSRSGPRVGFCFVEAQTDQGQMRRQGAADRLEQGFGGGQSAPRAG